jgi:hypothetical protein
MCFVCELCFSGFHKYYTPHLEICSLFTTRGIEYSTTLYLTLWLSESIHSCELILLHSCLWLSGIALVGKAMQIKSVISIWIQPTHCVFAFHSCISHHMITLRGSINTWTIFLWLIRLGLVSIVHHLFVILLHRFRYVSYLCHSYSKRGRKQIHNCDNVILSYAF